MDWNRRAPRPAERGPGASAFRERDVDRVEIDARTELRHRYSVEIWVRNVSSRGFMALCDEAVEIGSTVSLDLPGIGPVHAQVRWQIANRMGGMFVDPISLRQCAWTATRADGGEPPVTAIQPSA